MRPNLLSYLGKTVSVIVDRPLGTPHPRHPDIVYPINYGFLPDTVSGDGKEIDAYLIGITQPVREASGVVIAVIEREDDVEDKLVVTADERAWTADEIGAAVAFQEQYFRTRIRLTSHDEERAGTV